MVRWSTFCCLLSGVQVTACIGWAIQSCAVLCAVCSAVCCALCGVWYGVGGVMCAACKTRPVACVVLCAACFVWCAVCCVLCVVCCVWVVGVRRCAVCGQWGGGGVLCVGSGVEEVCCVWVVGMEEDVRGGEAIRRYLQNGPKGANCNASRRTKPTPTP